MDSKEKDESGADFGIKILTKYGYDPKHLHKTDTFCSWDLEYRHGDYLELIEVKLRRWDLDSFSFWILLDDKRSLINKESFKRKVNAVKQIQIFTDGFHIMDVTKIALCSDYDYITERHRNQNWQRNDYGGNDVPKDGSVYFRNDIGYYENKFVEPITFEEMNDIDNVVIINK